VLLGEDHICFTIPKTLPKNLSVPLYNLMNNEHMKEAQEGRAVLEDVEEDTFVGFCEFAYTGGYRSRMMEGVVPAPPEAWEPTAADKLAMPVEDTVGLAPFLGFGGLEQPRRTKGRISMTKAEQLWSDFKSLEFEDKYPHKGDEQLPAVNGGLSSASPTIESLLYHAKIY
jgi:hypothetical protein